MKIRRILDVQTQADAEKLLSLYKINYDFMRIKGSMMFYIQNGKNVGYRKAIYYIKRKELTF